MKLLEWSDLSKEEQKQAIGTYRYIRSLEEEKTEEEINVSYIVNCSFERQEDGYIKVII